MREVLTVERRSHAHLKRSALPAPRYSSCEPWHTAPSSHTLTPHCTRLARSSQRGSHLVGRVVRAGMSWAHSSRLARFRCWLTYTVNGKGRSKEQGFKESCRARYLEGREGLLACTACSTCMFLFALVRPWGRCWGQDPQVQEHHPKYGTCQPSSSTSTYVKPA